MQLSKPSRYLLTLFLGLIFVNMSEGLENNKRDKYALKRRRMVEEQIIPRGVENKYVVNAMLAVPRHEFVLPQDADYAYVDSPLSTYA